MKTCKHCANEYPNEKFYQRSNLCLDCRKLVMKEYYQANKEKILIHQQNYNNENRDKLHERQKNYYQENKSVIREKAKANRETNKEQIKSYVSEYRKKNRNVYSEKQKVYQQTSPKAKAYRETYLKDNNELLKEKSRQYYQKNKEVIKERQKLYARKQRETNPFFKLRQNINSLIRKSIQSKNNVKTSRTVDILGCSIQEFKEHLESHFKSWMNWDNYGLYNGELNYGWDIDHVIPVSSGLTESDIVNLNHYTNLLPLCSKVNRDIKRANKLEIL